MSKIEQLIKELCPGGVKHIPLEELCEFRNGYTPSKANKDFWEGGDIPWFRMEDIRENGRILSDSIQHITSKAIKGAGLFKANSIILATTATIGEHAMIIADSLANQRFTNLSIRKSLSSSVEPKYLFYYMFLVDEWCKNHVNVSGFASVDMPGLKKLQIPLPPLPIQEEIVRILDTFTEAQANLEQELELRKKQYEYYRNQLLTFDENDPSVRNQTVSDVADNYTGLTYKPDNISQTGTLVLRSSNIKNNSLCFDDNVFVTNIKIPNRAIVEENDILVCVRNGSRSLVGKCAMISKVAQGMAFGAFMSILRAKNISPKYLFYVWQKDSVIKQYKGDDAMPINQITSKDFNRIVIPVPPLDRQQEIVSILDKFESAIQTLEEELALRKKQYEYYREKLLTFN